MASLDSLQMSEEKKTYITKILNPVLEEFVTECLKNLPADPVDEMLSFCSRQGVTRLEDGSVLGKKSLGWELENARLKTEVERLKVAVEETGLMLSSLAKQEAKSASPGAMNPQVVGDTEETKFGKMITDASTAASEAPKEEDKPTEGPKEEAKSAKAEKEEAKPSDEPKDETKPAEEEAKPASEQK